MYNLFLDDLRQSKCLGDTRTWEVVRSYAAFVEKITKDGIPLFISFDHDLSDMHYPQSAEDYSKPIDYSSERYHREKTGYHCAKFLIEYCELHNFNIPEYQVHSMNPIGKQNIIQVIEGFKRIKGDIYRISNDIKDEAAYLDELMCNRGYDCESLRDALEKTLSMIKSCQNSIEMKVQSLKDV